MRVLFGGPGQLLIWAGILGWGGAAVVCLGLGRRGRVPVPWLAVAALPLGVLLYTAALFPALALFSPPVAVAVVAIAGLCGAGLAVRLASGTRAAWPGLRAWDRWVDRIAVALLLALAALIARLAGQYAYAVLVAAPWPAVLGEPSTGDLGLHALRVAMIAQHGLPPPSPLDPDYPLQYRYLFHVLAAAFQVASGAEVPLALASTAGLLLGCLTLAGAALGMAITGSRAVAITAGLLAPLYGPSYWLGDAWEALASGRPPGLSTLAEAMGGRWSLSPLTASFPTMITAQGSSPGLPVATLAWLALLLCLAAVGRSWGAARPASPDLTAETGLGVGPIHPGQDVVRARWAVGLAGVFMAVLVFAADFFAPLAAVALALAAVSVILGRVAETPFWGAVKDRLPWRRRLGRSIRPAAPGMRDSVSASASPHPGVEYHQADVLVGPSLQGLMVLALIGVVMATITYAILIGSTGQTGGVGSATGVRLTWNENWLSTPVYGGNHAILAGGAPLALPNWVQAHDWNVLFWPALALASAFRRRHAALVAGVTVPFVTALFWQLATVVYQTPVPTDFRVQMYRYASLATATLAPLLPIGAYALFVDRSLPAPWLPRFIGRVRAGIVWTSLILVGAGAGMYLLLGAGQLPSQSDPRWEGDLALARRLAQEPGARRLAVLGGPATFLEMYGQQRGGNLPIWWGFGGAAVPVGWDFGHPERYEQLYGGVVRRFDPAAAAELALTHVAVAPGQLAPDDQPRLATFLRQCGAVPVAAWDAGPAERWRQLFRVDAAACRRGTP